MRYLWMTPNGIMTIMMPANKTPDIAGMTSPVQCTHCRQVYDLAAVPEVLARYDDATVFKSPCCGRRVDDRSWKSMPDFDKLY